jgi:mannose-6-phosphate isomerase-like protein (cupin superfamily)
MTEFPQFLCNPANAAAGDEHAQGIRGYLFEGADGSQVVFWQSTDGGVSPPHTHDFDEYCIVVEGTFRGKIGGRTVEFGPGQECFIPAGVEHEGVYSSHYRAIDGFGGRRMK